ncbi:hypothetical protein ACNF49_43205 [Actinomadura sp. ATCC 39365]
MPSTRTPPPNRPPHHSARPLRCRSAQPRTATARNATHTTVHTAATVSTWAWKDAEPSTPAAPQWVASGSGSRSRRPMGARTRAAVTAAPHAAAGIRGFMADPPGW